MTSSKGTTRRNFLGTAAAGAAAAGAAFPRPAIAQLAKVRYTLSWLPTGQYAFMYSRAPARIFGRSAASTWKSRRGYGSMAAIQAVATGQFEMGGAGTGANLLWRS